MSAEQEYPIPAPGTFDSLLGPGSGAAAKVLGTHLRRLRHDRGLTLRDAAPTIGASVAKVSRLERGESPPTWQDVAGLADLYGVSTGPEYEELCELLRRVLEPAWWEAYSDVMPSWLKRLASLEDAATGVWTWHTMIIPGLLQTPAYARAIIRAGLPLSSSVEIERRVELRVMRQKVLTKPSPPRLLALLDEGALHRPVGGYEVLLEQLEWLRELDAVPGINIRIVTFAQSVEHPIAPTPVTHLRFATGGAPEVAYLEQADGATYVNDTQGLQTYRHLIEELALAAQRRKASLRLLDRAIRDCRAFIARR